MMLKMKSMQLSWFILMCTLLFIYVVHAETVGVKEDIKNLSDEDVLVISVSHSKKDKNITTSTEKLTTVLRTESSTEVIELSNTTLVPPIAKETYVISLTNIDSRFQSF